jgi:hypothetical protein
MAQTGSIVVRHVVGYLTDATAGVNTLAAQLAQDTSVDLSPFRPASVLTQNVSFELAEKALVVKYPAIHVYVDRVQNMLTEKFRMFSGKVRTIAEVRVSNDRIDEVEQYVKLYVEAITGVLDANRGCWGEGAFFAGAYDVSFEPMKHGGKNFLQIAKVTFEVDLSS